MWATEQSGLDFLYETSTKGYVPTDVHGVIRAEARRGVWKVQWFADDALQLFDMPPARIFTLLPDEWRKDTEAKFRPIYEVHSCSFSIITLGNSPHPSPPIPQ